MHTVHEKCEKQNHKNTTKIQIIEKKIFFEKNQTIKKRITWNGTTFTSSFSAFEMMYLKKKVVPTIGEFLIKIEGS